MSYLITESSGMSQMTWVALCVSRTAWWACWLAQKKGGGIFPHASLLGDWERGKGRNMCCAHSLLFICALTWLKTCSYPR